MFLENEQSTIILRANRIPIYINFSIQKKRKNISSFIIDLQQQLSSYSNPSLEFWTRTTPSVTTEAYTELGTFCTTLPTPGTLSVALLVSNATVGATISAIIRFLLTTVSMLVVNFWMKSANSSRSRRPSKFTSYSCVKQKTWVSIVRRIDSN